MSSLTVRHPWLDTALYPFQTHTFATAAGSMAYVDEGAGPPVLLLHGTPSWSFEWRQVILDLRATHRVIAPDLLGFGLSDRPTEGLGLLDHVQRLHAFVEALDLHALTLVVHDFGGPIGLPLALDTPRVARLIVINSWMWPSEGDRAIARIDRLVRSALGRFLYRRLSFSARVLLPAAFGDRKRLTPAVRRHYLAPLSGSARAREGTYALACALRGGDDHYARLWAARDRLARLPMSLVWGEKDPLLTAQHRDRWIEAFPHARVVRVADAGHFVAEERPDAVVEAVRA
jgi:pimeloyl-ACP methyl ester carboxylesterase